MDVASEQRLLRKLHASQSDEWVVIRWEYVGDAPGEVIVVKSDAGNAGALAGLFVEHPDQRAICFDTGTQRQGQDVMDDVTSCYTVFAQAPDGSWHKQGAKRVHARRTLKEYERIEFHEDGTLLAKLDGLRLGMFSGGGYSMGGT